jgi:hypothetical protein
MMLPSSLLCTRSGLIMSPQSCARVARAHGAAVGGHGAGAALGETAAQLASRQLEVVAQDVQQWDVGVVRIDLHGLPR